MTRRSLLAAVLASASIPALIVVPATPAHAIPVFDAANYAQNLLIAARTLNQIRNQITSLQNEAAMLTNMATQLKRLDFSSLQQITRSMQRIDTLMAQAEGIAFDLRSTDDALRNQFPAEFDRALTTSQIINQARTGLQAATQAFRQTMRVQAQVAENIQQDGPLLAELVTQSQSATGSLQAQQAGNQLTALAVRQSMQLQTMMAAQYRAEAIEQARQAQAMEAARERTRRFVGSAHAYTPQ